MIKNASNGLQMEPLVFVTPMFLITAMSSALPMITPAITSPWPLRYFVTECSTMSAPHASGRCTGAGANVLSTTTRMPSPTVRFTPAISVTFMSGFVGVSKYTIFVFGLTAAATASRSDVSTGVTSMPNFGMTSRMTTFVQPYTQSPTITWSPACKRPSSTELTAPMPLPAATQSSPPSMAAILSSSVRTVGLPPREYT